MKKIALLFIFILAFGCTKKEDSKIKFWNFWSEPSQTAVLKELISEFEKENDCQVELTELTWNDGKTKLMFAFNSETAPDVMELGSDWIAQFSSSGVLYEMNKDSMKTSEFLPNSLAPGMWKSKFFALPWVIDTRVMFYNKDLASKAGLNTAPTTLDQMLELATAINDAGAFGYGANGSDPHRLYKKILPFFWTYGGEIINDSGKSALFSPQNIAALEKYAELSRTGLVETQREIDAQFAQGKVGFWNSGSWLFKKLAKADFQYGIFPLPGKAGEIGTSFAGGEYLSINAKSKNIEKSKKLVAFLTSEKAALQLCQKIPEAGFPANIKGFENDFFKNDANKNIFREQLKTSKMTPVHPKWLEIEAIIENAVVEVLLAKKSAYGALLEAHNQINNLLEPNV
jgi:multiple sugar transport system substrate-binding protein